MRLHDCAHDGKTHAHAVIFGGKEWVEELFRDLLGYARPCVCNRDFGELPISPRLHCHGFLCLFRSDMASKPIQDQIGKDLLQLDWIAVDPERRAIQFAPQHDLARFRLRRQEFDCFSNLIVQIQSLFLSKGAFFI